MASPAMNAQLPFFFMILCSASMARISDEQCDTIKYKEPVTTFRVDDRLCGSDRAKSRVTIHNNTFGIVNIRVDFREDLKVGEYIFELEDADSSMLHTRQKFVICSECGEVNQVLTSCAKELNFNVSYVFDGNYNTAVKFVNGTKIWDSGGFSVKTNYTKISLDPDNRPMAGGCIAKRAKSQLEVHITTNKTVFYKPPSITIALVPKSVQDDFESSSDVSATFCHPNYTHTCHGVDNNHTCTFEVAPGEYYAVAIAYDPRCDNETLWTNNFYECVTKKECYLEAANPTSVNSTQRIVIGSIILVAIVACAAFLLVKKLKVRSKTRFAQNARYSPQTTNDANEYLVVYARESEQFERVVDKLKELLSCGGCSKVTTLYDLDQKCLEPRRWLQQKLRDDNVKIILLVNIAAGFTVNRNAAYKKPHCFDFLFRYALLLLDMDEQRSYHNLYKVVTPEGNEEEFKYLNTLTAYNVPQHTEELLQVLRIDCEELSGFVNDFKGECNVYRDYVLENQQFVNDIFYFY